MRKALDLFAEGGRQHILEGRYVVQGTRVVLEHTDACYRQDVVQARLPGDMRESWGEDIKLPRPFRQCTVQELDDAVLQFFNRWPDSLTPCPRCSQMTWNRKHFRSQYRDERCGDCWFADFDAKMAKMRAEEADEQHKADVLQYHNGMRYRTSCWVHPHAGDDFEVDLYTVDKIDSVEAQRQLREKYPTASRFDVAPIYQLPSH